ncbi:MAG: hypothetical protein ABMA13_22650 [Chthoniobacteraceae bacterium]
MASKFSIKSTIPAVDWFAVFDDYDDSLPKEKAVAVPLVCFAVIENRHGDGYDEVVPMHYDLEMGVEIADGENFIGCLHKTDVNGLQAYADLKRGRKK